MIYLRPTIIGLLALAALLALFAQGQPAHAATFTVTKTADTNDGTCDGDCSLREAIGAANALGGADTITVPAGTYTLSITGTGEDANATGDLDISDDLTINGTTQAIIDGGALDRVFHIVSGTVTISYLTVRNGSETFGGGIFSSGTMTLTNSTVSGNTAGNDGGGIFTNGGTVTLNSSSVSGNTASNVGGGIRNGSGITVTLNSSTVSGNTAGSFGGGILNFGTLTITNSTVSGNTATASLGGGGILNDGTLTLNSSTVSGNSAPTSNGGGIRNFGTVTLKNTIVANSTSGGDCSGTITSAGYNLDSDGTCGLSGTGDLSSGNANLGSLALNAPGTTATHALLSGSDAIDAGNPATPGSGGNACEATDQRGVARPQGTFCDIGAFELEAPVGGIAEVLVGGGEAPARTGAGSGSSSLLYAAIVGGTAAAVALAAAGWYARRRFRQRRI